MIRYGHRKHRRAIVDGKWVGSPPYGYTVEEVLQQIPMSTYKPRSLFVRWERTKKPNDS